MHIPEQVISLLKILNDSNYEAFVIGGCVRDLLLGRKPKDWDITTNALPEKIQNLFPKHFYNNRFGTVTVLTESPDPILQKIEITTYRVDVGYSDQRHPDNIKLASSLKEDLARRDFTINAMAAAPDTGTPRQDKKLENSFVLDGIKVIDPYGGAKDLNDKMIRAVGKPSERFSEDALRLLRAIRLAAELDFTIEEDTWQALTSYCEAIVAVSHERVRDELIKIVQSEHPEKGFELLKDSGVLGLILPEVADGIGVTQNKHHKFTVFVHNVKSLQFAANYNYQLSIRLAALFHDIGKPATRRRKGDDYTFYGHDIVGARMTNKLMKRLRFSNELVDKVTHLVRHHMFYYDVGKVTEAGARRLLRRVGMAHFDDLIKLRIAERKGSGVPKAEPYRLRHLQFLVEKAAQAPITVGQLAIRGNDLIASLSLKPGPQIGGILNALLAEVLEAPEKNDKAVLLKRAAEIKDLDPVELKKLGAAAIEEEEQKREDDIKRKYHV